MRIAWTGEELKRLVALVDAEGRDWSRIASLWRSAGYSARSEKSLEGRTDQRQLPAHSLPPLRWRACPVGGLQTQANRNGAELTRPGVATGYYKLQRDKAAGAEAVAAEAAPPAEHSLAGVDADAPWTVFWDCLEARGWTCTQGRRKGIDFLYAPPGSKPHPPYRLRVVSGSPRAALRI